MPTARLNSWVGVSTTVEIPFASRNRAASPTDRQQKGQAGVRSAASTCSRAICTAIGAMAVSMNSVLSHWNP